MNIRQRRLVVQFIRFMGGNHPDLYRWSDEQLRNKAQSLLLMSRGV